MKNLFHFSRTVEPGFPQMQGLLEMLADPALLLDDQTGKIVQANAKAVELTLYTRQELAQLTLAQLCPSPPVEDFLAKLRTDRTGEVVLATRNAAEVHASALFTPLDEARQWAVLSLRPLALERHLQEQRARPATRLQAIAALTQAASEQPLRTALDLALQAAQTLTGSDVLAIYHCAAPAGDSASTLERVALLGAGDFLPASIPFTVLSTLRNTHSWIPGRRALTPLHRAARVANMAYMVTAPLAMQQGANGLMLFAGASGALPEDSPALAEIVASVLTAILRYHATLHELNQDLQAQADHQAAGSTIFDLMEEGVLLVTPDARILEINPAAEMILGYASGEIEGEPVEHILVGAETLMPALRRASAGTPTHDLGAATLHRRTGQPFPCKIRTIPVLRGGNPGGAVEKIIIACQDLSTNEGLRLLNQQLEQRALLGEVTAIFAHEVRNPINNISTALQVMALDLPPKDPLLLQIERMQQDCDRLTHLMKSVLSFARPVEYSMEPLDIAGLLKRLLERWHPRLVGANVEARIQAPADLPRVMGNTRALDQVFSNLIGNGVEAMVVSAREKGGLLAVRIEPIREEDRELLEISISDTGRGIPDELREKIFNPFFTTSSQGTGLGLSIAKRIITAHKGSMHVSSFPGGAIFRVRLPVQGVQELPRGAESGGGSESSIQMPVPLAATQTG